jgi:hypothetical protein
MNEILRLPLDRCGWRSLVQIAQGTGFPPNSLYGKRRGHVGSDLQELITYKQIEMRYFGGERGRGGEVMRFTITDPRRFPQRKFQVQPADLGGDKKAAVTLPETSYQDKGAIEERRRHLAKIMFTDMMGYESSYEACPLRISPSIMSPNLMTIDDSS